ncbi:ral GTPase-activating protein subunit beta-like isoform X2 [Gigantopelta aegis]|uniref:ral GTPase-activating protein subunit beta-like isoform X2 n=1 Tax=Gigantopelta aegis TaxID=1735272 RepID=UPI001B88A7F6|nr:ral GTPase-activating protein subunit beta-like isoform X2 [Gigantopelta aegis]
MYSEWSSLQEEIQSGKGNQSVLNNFPPGVGQEVASVVVRNIAANLSISAASDEPSNLKDDKDVKWTMEVLCFGLGLPLTEHDTINDCVKVYCEWLTALIIPKPCVPKPVIEDPNPYAQSILLHLLNLFKPRPQAGVDLVKRQALLCHRVLRAIESVAKESYMLTRATWESLLKFLLAATDSLLSPPTEKDDIGDHLCERVLSVLFGIWIISCSKCFPSPSLWKTFHNMCLFWRHHEALVIQWHKINHALTSHLVRMMYGPGYPELLVCEDDMALIPSDISQECITQSWFRFLHILQNPVDLSKPMIIGGTQRFLQYALSSHDVVEPSQHECLQKLPVIFYKAMRGVSIMINAFLGLSQSVKEENLMAPQSTCKQTSATPVTPPGQRKMAKPMQVLAGTLTQRASSKPSHLLQKLHLPPTNNIQTHLCIDNQLPFSPSRPRCNSILHLFGAWLFDAALVGVKLHSLHAAPDKPNRTSSFLESLTSEQVNSDVLCDNTYESGRAEAVGTLCRMFSSHKTGEEILPIYFSRFYLCVYYGLQTDENVISGQVLVNILFNSCDLLRVDLTGVHILVPYFLSAIELVLVKSPDFKHCEHISYVELRKACIHLLLSMLCLPLHFKDLEIKDTLNSHFNIKSGLTFLSLKARTIDLLQKALSNETDSANTQMLLGGLMLLVQDLATCENAEENVMPVKDASSDRISHVKHDSAYSLFGHATSLVCNRLMASWKSELNTALAAMELLAGLAKVSIQPPNMLMCKRTVKWICDFIVYQCSRPAPSHSRDLHSMIVAAFKCLLLWLVEHSSLLYDKECLHYVLEVVELGISGSKSQGKVQESQNVKTKVDEKSKNVTPKNRASDPPKFKGEKQLMPASMRVKDAAEAVLTCIIDQVGAFPPPCGPESLFSLLDERTLLRYAKGSGLIENGSPFRYYVIDNSIVVGLLEQPLGSVEDPLPTVTALIRGPFGRHAWTMQLRHSPRCQKISTQANLNRPTPDNNVGIHHKVEHRYFPESIEKIPLTNADKSIPPMESLITDENQNDLEKLAGYIEKSISFEKEVSERVRWEKAATPYPNPLTECKPPKICPEYQTARLFLSHYGFLSLECLKEPSNSSVPPALVMLDTSNPAIFADLETLDHIPSRDNDTLHIFYVKSGQRTVTELLSNVVSSSKVQPQFLEFLHSLGWPVDVRKHAGWTGHISSSWRTTAPESVDVDDYQTNTGGSIYDGRQQVLYWADVTTEMAFVVPSPESYNQRITTPVNDSERSPTMSKNVASDSLVFKPKTLILESEKAGVPPKESPGSPSELNVPSTSATRTRRLGRQSATMAPEFKVFTIWLENFEDHDYVPTDEMINVASTGQEQIPGSNSGSSLRDREVYIIFIHALQNGLFRIHLHKCEKSQTKMSMAIPLVDGMLVSRRTLGTMVRQTAINICRRKRMDSEMYQPPHVRRKFKIQEIVNKYRVTLTEAEFYTSLFEKVPK